MAQPAPAGEDAGPREQRLMELLLHSMDSAAIALDCDGRLLLANPAAGELGLVRDGALAVPGLRAVIRAAQGDRKGREVELDVSPDGERTAPVPLAVRVLSAPAGDVLILASDRSEARRTDAVRGDFVANVSHELKTPVGALILLAEALEAGQHDPDTVGRFTAQLRREASRLSRLVQELIDLSRLQYGEAPPAGQRVQVSRLIRQAVERVAPSAQAKQVRVRARLGSRSGAAVAGDGPQLVTAIANLLDNAVAYSPAAAEVWVRTRSSGAEVEIQVADHGIGIAPEHQQRIFERFYRVDPARSRATGGTGLGLAIVKHVVANHEGRIALHSEVGRGSVFTVTLPGATPAPAGEQ